VVVAGCGFQPMYGKLPGSADTDEALSRIAIQPIPERFGQLLRIELGKRLNPRGVEITPAYTLSVKVNENKQNLAVRKDDTATRANLIIQAEFLLGDVRTKEVVFTGKVRSINSYDILDAQFATLSAENDARRRAARDLANEIGSRVGVFLTRSPAG